MRFAVPALWGIYEVVSGLRKAITAGVLTDEEAYAAVESLVTGPSGDPSDARAPSPGTRLGGATGSDRRFRRAVPGGFRGARCAVLDRRQAAFNRRASHRSKLGSLDW